MRAAVCETHTSTLLLVDDQVYKRKKPLDLGFSDFRTYDARRRACEEEVRLNRRLAPDVYQGVATLLDPDGEPCEALVVMRRLPADRSLSALVAAGADVDDALRAVAGQLAALHARSPVTAERSGNAARAVLGRLCDEALDTVATWPDAVPPSLVDLLRRQVRTWLAAHERLLERRVTEGRVYDGHGDLLADDVFVLDDGPRVLDCLEFDADLRVVDGVHDAASLAMDLERLGAPRQAVRFLQLYAEAAGDDAPRTLVHFYTAYRALVRAKVAVLRAEQGDRHAATQALLLSVLARDHLLSEAPRLVLVGGLPGSGKSTVARGVATRRGWACLSTDALRPQVVAGFEERYAPAARGAVYHAMLQRAGDVLAEGGSVVLDATFSDSAWRRSARALGEAMGADVVELVCTAPDGVADDRLRTREPAGSEATPLVRAALQESWQPWPEARLVDCAGDPASGVAQALAQVPEEPRPLSPWRAPATSHPA